MHTTKSYAPGGWLEQLKAKFADRLFFSKTDSAGLLSYMSLTVVPCLDGYLGDYELPNSVDFQSLKANDRPTYYVLAEVEGHWMVLGSSRLKKPKVFRTLDAIFKYFTFYPPKHDCFKGHIGIANINGQAYYGHLNKIGRILGYVKKPEFKPTQRAKGKVDPLAGLGAR